MEELAFTLTPRVRKSMESCPVCGGRGWWDEFDVMHRYVGKKRCTACGGEGRVPTVWKVTER